MTDPDTRTLERVRFIAFHPHNTGRTLAPKKRAGTHEITPAERIGWRSTKQIRDLIGKAK